MELQSFICEYESKSYSIPEIKFYASSYYMGHVIPEHLNENWNFLVKIQNVFIHGYL